MNLAKGLFVLGLGCLASASIAAYEPRLHSLVVYGDGFALTVKEPPGWFADTTIAHDFGADVLFYPATQHPYAPTTPLIRILVTRKNDANAAVDLKRDMDSYRTRFPNVEFRDHAVTHPRYRVYAKVFSVPGRVYKYAAYLNPSPTSGMLISVVLTVSKQPAASFETTAYKRVVASLDTSKAP